MEMSPRQIWKRFIQIEQGWTEEELAKKYASTDFRIADKFDWLNVDYQSCFAIELEKRISMLPVKPEVVVIDHMGLLLSKHRDLNLKMEEIAGALTDVAVKLNLIVFAISEITKSAITEGMGIASSRGSFRIAYNASKILSLTPTKGLDGNINTIMVKTTANREKGSFDAVLRLDGIKIMESTNG